MVLICAQELVLGHLPRVPTVMEPAALDEKLPLGGTKDVSNYLLWARYDDAWHASKERQSGQGP